MIMTPKDEMPRTAVQQLEEQTRRNESERLRADLEARVKIDQERLKPGPGLIVSEEDAKAMGMPINSAPPPASTTTRVWVRSGPPYDEVGRLKWTLKSQLEQLRALKGHFINEDARHIALAITHLEDSLFRLNSIVVVEHGC